MIIIKRFTDLFYGRIINFYNHTMCFWEECIVSNLWLNTLYFSTGSILCVIQTFYLFINYSPVWSVHYRGMCVWYHLQWLFSPTLFTPAFLLFLEQAKNSSSSGPVHSLIPLLGMLLSNLCAGLSPALIQVREFYLHPSLNLLAPSLSVLLPSFIFSFLASINCWYFT